MSHSLAQASAPPCRSDAMSSFMVLYLRFVGWVGMHNVNVGEGITFPYAMCGRTELSDDDVFLHLSAPVRLSIRTDTHCKGVPRGEAVAQRLKGICGQNGTVDRSGITLSNQSIRIPLQSLRASFPPGDAFATPTSLFAYPF